MFSNLTIAILIGLGSGAWIFARVHNKSGKNTQSSLIVAGIAGIIIIILVTTILGFAFKKS